MPESLDKLPSPYLSGVFDLRSAASVELVMSRGCANKCSYCAINESPLRYFSYNRIKKELDYVLARAPRLRSMLVTVADMYENDALAARVLPLLRRAAERRRFRVFFYVNVASLRKDALLRLSDSPWFDVEVGIQSIRPDILRLCRRLPDPAVIKANIENFKALAPSANKTLGLISFLPGDDEKGYFDSLEWAISTGLGVAVNHLRVIPGTELHRKCAAMGVKVSPDYPYFVTRTDKLGPAAVRRLSALTGEVFFALRALAADQGMKKDFFRTAAALRAARPHLFLAGALAGWWARRPATAPVVRIYRANVEATGSLDRNPETGSFSPGDLRALNAEYARFKEFMGRRTAA